jgi:hypothetical protein
MLENKHNNNKFLITLITLFIFSFSLSFAERYEIKLSKGWNLISIPYENYYIAKIEGKVHPIGYLYIPQVGAYNKVDLYSLSSQEGGIWVYSFDDNGKIIVEGIVPLTLESVSSKIMFSSPQKRIFNLISLPTGASSTSLKKICENIRIYYYNSTDKCWYSYNVSSGEYKRYCKDKWELIGVFGDIRYPEGAGVFVRLDPSCHSQRLNLAYAYSATCESDSDRSRPDNAKCSSGESCESVTVDGINTYKCRPCKDLPVEICKNRRDRCAIQKWIKYDGEEERCVPKEEGNKVGCIYRTCGEGENCCIVHDWLGNPSGGVCYNPELVSCGAQGLECKNEACDKMCKEKERGEGSCSFSSRTPYKESFKVGEGTTIDCYCSLPSIKECSIRLLSGIGPIEVYRSDLPYTLKRSLRIEYSSCPQFKIEIIEIRGGGGNVVFKSETFEGSGQREITVELTVSELPTKYSISANIKEESKEIGSFEVKEARGSYLRIYLEPKKERYNQGESVSIKIQGHASMKIKNVKLLVDDYPSASLPDINPGKIDTSYNYVLDFSPLTEEKISRGICFKVRGEESGYGKVFGVIVSNEVCAPYDLSLRLSADKTKLPVWETATIIAEVKSPGQVSPYLFIVIYEGDHVNKECRLETCVSMSRKSSPGVYRYIAKVKDTLGKEYATSNPVEIEWREQSVSISADKRRLKVGESTKIIATVEKDVESSGYYLRIYEGDEIVKSCVRGTTCEVIVSKSNPGTYRYIAKLEDLAFKVKASSETIEITWEGPTTTTTVPQCTKSSDCKATDTDGGNNVYQQGTCTAYYCSATGKCEVSETRTDSCTDSSTVYEWWPYNEICVGGYVSCPSGYRCSNGACVSISTTTTTPSEWSVTISADPTNLPVGGSSTIKATANRDLSGTNFIRIYEGNRVIYACNYGTSCSTTVTKSNPGTYSYVAKIENIDGSEVKATSNTISVTWFAYSGVIEGLTASPNPARARETVTLSFIVKNTGTQRTTYRLVGKAEGSCVNQQGQRDITLNPGESQTINVQFQMYDCTHTQTVELWAGEVKLDSKSVTVQLASQPTTACEGSISLNLQPNPAFTYSTITATASGLTNCQGKTIYIRKNSCTGEQVASCTSSSTGCSTTFSGPTQDGDYYYYACIDKNGDGDFDDTGEYSRIPLTVKKHCRDIGGTCTSQFTCLESLGGYCYQQSRDYGCSECCCITQSQSGQSQASMIVPIISIPVKAGWNLISFPFVDYRIIEAKDVNSLVYVYNPETSSYEQLDISKVSGKGFWAYAYKDTNILVEGSIPLTADSISLVANKPNLIAIPKNGLYVNSQKGNCIIARFYYFNSTDKSWYRWDAKTKEYSRYNESKKAYEVVRIDSNPFIQEGSAIFLYSENDCKLG